jgi:hypothetical protein
MRRRMLATRTAVSALAVALALSGSAAPVGAAVAPRATARAAVTAAAVNPSPPASPVKLIFIHHSTGQAWLTDDYGNLGRALRDNRYFVSDTNYGWGPDAIGDRTDVGDWWTWFRGPSAGTYMTALYAESGKTFNEYSRLASNPGGTNTVVMFKSCFPNSAVGGSPSDPIPLIGSNPLRGNGTSDLTVGNAKGIYRDLLTYFGAHPEKLFVLIVSPPLRAADTNAGQAANARALANWLVDPNGWLQGYAGHNVMAWDYFTVLTGGHHRIVDGAAQHTAGSSNYLAYATGDSHPLAAGDRLATAEFVPMLNAAYNTWKGNAGDTLSRPAVSPGSVAARTAFGVTGSLAPTHTAGTAVRLTFRRQEGASWVDVLTVDTSTSSRRLCFFRATCALGRTGSYAVRASHRNGAATFYGPWAYFTVTP